MNEFSSTITMTSLELVELINSQRVSGQPELRHDNFMAKVPKVLGSAAPKFLGTVQRPQPIRGIREYPCYRFPKREACLMAMSYSYELQTKVFDHMTKLEDQIANEAKPTFDPNSLSRLDIARMLFEAETEKLKLAEEKKALEAETSSQKDKSTPWRLFFSSELVGEFA